MTTEQRTIVLNQEPALARAAKLAGELAYHLDGRYARYLAEGGLAHAIVAARQAKEAARASVEAIESEISIIADRTVRS